MTTHPLIQRKCATPLHLIYIPNSCDQFTQSVFFVCFI